MNRWMLVLLVACCLTPNQGMAVEPSAESAAAIDQAVLSQLSSRHGTKARVIAHTDLTKPFGTKSQWALVVAKDRDTIAGEGDLDWEHVGPIAVCFVKDANPDCSEAPFLAAIQQRDDGCPSPTERPFRELFDSRIVHADRKSQHPLLLVKACGLSGANGDCPVSTLLFDYDRSADSFRTVFFNLTGRNQNAITRFIESGPLIGEVVTASPTNDAPYAYWVEVHRRSDDGRYVRILRYRSKTRYGDGNRLAVIDSEMPEIMRRLGVWKSGDSLPIPPTMPEGCTRLTMRKGVVWCE